MQLAPPKPVVRRCMIIRFLLHCSRNYSHQTTAFFTHESLQLHGSGLGLLHDDSELPIAIDREKLAALCRARGVRKLSLFGSEVRGDFNPNRSDVDALVEYLPGKHPGMRHFRFQDELADMLGRNVDLD